MRATVLTGALLATLVPVATSAVTVDQIVALSKAGISEPVILALIDRDKTIFSIEPEQLITLKRQGVTEAVVIAMLKSGREEGEQAVRSETASTAAILSGLSPAPDVVIVGHGPDIPNTTRANYDPSVAAMFPVPYAVPYLPPYGLPYAVRRFDLRRDRTTCLAQQTFPGSSRSFSFMTACPAVTQPYRNRFVR